MRVWMPLAVVWGVLVAAVPAWAAHAYAQFGDVKYPPGFTHFDYVNPDAPKGGEFRLVPGTTPTNFDKFNPFTLKGTAPPGIASLMFESLLAGNAEEPTTAYGLLAEDVEVAPDKLSATFRLNPAARFNDGSTVQAEDVKFSFDTLTGPLAAPQFRTIYAEVKGVAVLGPGLLRFDFASPNAELPLVVGGMPVFSRKWGGGKPFDQITTDLPIASGPYRPMSARLGRDIGYQRDPKYWAVNLPVRKGHYNFDRISFKLYLDDTAKFEGLKAGEFDFMREFTSRNWARQYKGKVFDRGELKKRAFESHNPGDFQGYVFNVRNPKFQDARVRQALGLAFDFEWLNRQLFFGIYKRVDGYFPNSDFHAHDLPGADELALLEPLRAKLSPAVFGPAPVSPSTAPPSSLRDNLRKARDLLAQAGWTYRDGALRNARGEPMNIELLNNQPSLSRVVAPLQAALLKLGVTLEIRNVDSSLYQQRMDNFEFEMSSIRIPGSTAPGGELFEYFGSKSADTNGSANIWGIKDAAVDALLGRVVKATTRAELATAMRALDRVLSNGYYSIPQYYSDAFLIGYRQHRFVLPPTIPPYYQADSWAMSTWWASPENR
ncbi:ABC transporter substrate-binding protein [Xylophilus rhododendri]|uniref:ABC transporter substrate-binding protein n=1 Tax=Xylophilus rhododendri TaxID=2697032 RepID=A0A857J158_9BURK|nr:ABC transporter substrate-binding protein [Xylophilus rhododendri]